MKNFKERPMEDPRITARRQSHKVSGRPVSTPETKGFENTRAFQEALILNRADKSIPTVERSKREASLVLRRRQQLGER